MIATRPQRLVRLNRHLKSEYKSADLIDIIKDPDFVKANEAYKAAIVELKKSGKGDVKHHETITDNAFFLKVTCK